MLGIIEREVAWSLKNYTPAGFAIPLLAAIANVELQDSLTGKRYGPISCKQLLRYAANEGTVSRIILTYFY